MPLPSTRPFHPAWAAHHAPALDRTRTGQLTIRRGGTAGGWDPVDGPTPGTDPTVIHTGPFRARAIDVESQPVDAAAQQVTIRSYLISVAVDAPEPAVGDTITIDESPDDPHLAGKLLTVTGVGYGTHLPERHIYADLDLTNQEA